MAQFPNALYTPRTVANRVGVSYDAAKTKVFYAEDINTPNDEIIAIEEALGLNPEGSFTSVVDRLDDVDTQLADLNEDGGWRACPVVPTRQSADDPVFVLRFGADMTTILSPGMRIKVTQQSTSKYFIVVAVGSYTGGNTDITVYGGIDYDVNDTSTYPITAPLYSREKAPFGFPLNPIKWTVEMASTANATQSSPATGTWYNLGSLNIVIPIGLWRTTFEAVFREIVGSATTVLDGSMALSTSASSASDAELKSYNNNCGASSSALQFIHMVKREKILLLSAKTTYYLIASSPSGIPAGGYMEFRGDLGTTIIRAACAYI